jgi:hypothetical protein
MNENLQHGHAAKTLGDAGKKFLAMIDELHLIPIKLDGAVGELNLISDKLISHIGKAKEDLKEGKLSEDQFNLIVGTIKVCVGTVEAHKVGVEDKKEQARGEIMGLKRAIATVSKMRDFELAAKARVESVQKEADETPPEDGESGLGFPRRTCASAERWLPPRRR